MSVISRVRRFFAQTISGYTEVMREEQPDWHLVAKRMMCDFRLFNAEICDIPSDAEHQKQPSSHKKSEPVQTSDDSSVFFDAEWEKASDFDINVFEQEEANLSSIKRGYERDSDYEPENKQISTQEMKEEQVRPKQLGSVIVRVVYKKSSVMKPLTIMKVCFTNVQKIGPE